jgi:biopolymer transport protein TolR
VRKRRSVSEINVVPYIDVMLVLLIIFMVTAPLLKQGVDVDLPTAPANPLDVESPEPIVITVDREGQMYLSTALNPDSGISAEMVRGDANGPYQNVVATLVLLQQANVGSVGLVTDPEETN